MMLDVVRTFIGQPPAPDEVVTLYTYLELVFASIITMFIITKFFETLNVLIGFDKQVATYNLYE